MGKVKCPFEHTLGIDIEQFEDCDECEPEMRNKCADEERCLEEKQSEDELVMAMILDCRLTIKELMIFLQQLDEEYTEVVKTVGETYTPRKWTDDDIHRIKSEIKKDKLMVNKNITSKGKEFLEEAALDIWPLYQDYIKKAKEEKLNK